ncbi:hypothetical protein evm_014600 [Chilo suppressalis]|nr:hypothetical protein evm_014600 [Chilo suppressalis]
MSNSKNKYKLADKIKTDTQTIQRNEDEEEAVRCGPTESCTYAVTVSKKTSSSGEEESTLCSGQKSFISIHSTDQLCQVADIDNPLNLDECHVEVLSLNEVFPSTSEESLSNEDDSPAHRKHRHKNKSTMQKCQSENAAKSGYVPTNSESSTQSGRQKASLEGQSSGYSDFDIPKNTMYVVGSNPGEPKMSYQDPPKKISKTMKKFLRNIDKHKNDQNCKINEKALSKLTTMRGILKDGRCVPECTGDSVQSPDEYNARRQTALTESIAAGTSFFKKFYKRSHAPAPLNDPRQRLTRAEQVHSLGGRPLSWTNPLRFKVARLKNGEETPPVGMPSRWNTSKRRVANSRLEVP